MKRFVVLEGFWEKFTDEEKGLIWDRAHEARMTVNDYVTKVISDWLDANKEETP